MQTMEILIFLYTMLKTMHLVSLLFWISTLSLSFVMLVGRCLPYATFRYVDVISNISLVLSWSSGILLFMISSGFGYLFYVKVLIAAAITVIHIMFMGRKKAIAPSCIQGI